MTGTAAAIERLINFHRRIDDFEETRSAPANAAWIVLYFKLAQRLDKVLSIGNEVRDHANGDQVLQGEISTQTYQYNYKEISQNIGERHQHQGIGIGIYARFIYFLVAGAEAFDRHVTAAECFHHTLAADRLPPSHR